MDGAADGLGAAFSTFDGKLKMEAAIARKEERQKKLQEKKEQRAKKKAQMRQRKKGKERVDEEEAQGHNGPRLGYRCRT